jgi:hypothetical protein
MRPLQRLLPRDPRDLQIAFLGSFLVLGVAFLRLPIEPWMPPLLLVSTCAVQWACERVLRLRSSGFRSPLITGLGLSLLLRTDAVWVPPLAAIIAIGAKYLIRVRGKHVFNPGMLGLTVCILFSGHAWCSPSQWGEGMAMLAWFAVLGLAVVSRSFRTDVSLAFLGSWVLLKLGRVLWLGQRPAVLGHQLLVGSLILFTFFMISDPKTTPDRRSARIGWAMAVAVLAFVLQHQAWVMNAPVWALLLLSPAVPLLDRLFPASRFTWPSGQPSLQGVVAVPAPAVRRVVPMLVLPLLVLLHPAPALAFCGFYVGKADTQLFNDSSQVALVRDGNRTVLTMSNDYRGPLTEFALVVPVPTVLEREQIHIGDRKLLEHLDAYSAPRLVEYFDPDPCQPIYPMAKAASAPTDAMAGRSAQEKKRDQALGVSVEAKYTVGEYDILILGAKQSEGLETWLRENGYRVPAKAAAALQPYIRQDMKFFVAKVNLEAQKASGVQYLRPLQIADESKKFMLPIRLGMANAAGPQDMIVYALTRRGRVESTNYRTIRIPSDANIPVFVKGDFGKFYQDAFARSVDKEDRRAVFTEYVWDMGWCDPCAAQPLSREELRQLGVFWLDDPRSDSLGPAFRRGAPVGGPVNVLLTRLHVRYDGANFPEDLVFQETSDRTNFQARYILQHPYKGSSECSAMDDYRERLRDRRIKEAETLASLTGWSMQDIKKKMGPDGDDVKSPRPWYRRLWND